jgi:hypothetical protein
MGRVWGVGVMRQGTEGSAAELDQDIGVPTDQAATAPKPAVHTGPAGRYV